MNKNLGDSLASTMVFSLIKQPSEEQVLHSYTDIFIRSLSKDPETVDAEKAFLKVEIRELPIEVLEVMG